MPVLNPGRTVKSREPLLTVENELEPGTWLFRLTVVDDEGKASEPADLVIRVVGQLVPNQPAGPGGIVTGPAVPPIIVRPPSPPRRPPRRVGPVR